MSFDPQKIRKDFPIFERKVREKPLVYFDSAATTQKPTFVLDAIENYYRLHNANIHRGVHTLSEEATTMVDAAREKVARFIKAPGAQCVVFTRNTTEAINLVAYSWGRKFLKAGDEILLTELEHHSNIVPWQLLAQEKGAKLRFLRVGADGCLDLDEAARAFSPKTKLFSFTAVSNALGTINPVKKLVELAHKNGAIALVDGAQRVPHMPFDVGEADCDFLAFSGHKMLGPTGTGVLYGKESLLESMPPFLGGGDMIQEVTLERSTYNVLPFKFEAGTPDIAGIIGLGAAVDYLSKIGMEAVRRHEAALIQAAMKRIKQESDVTVYGPQSIEDRSGVISFNIGDIHPHDIGQVFDMEGVAVRVGHHCCQPLMRKLGVAGTARASFYLYNTEKEIDALIRGIERAKDFFKIPAGAERELRRAA